MSGLVQFFQAFTPHGNSATATDSEQQGEEDEQVLYAKSLTEDLASSQDHDENDNDDDDDDDDAFEDDEYPDYTVEPLDYAEWRVRRNEVLTTYFQKRFLPKEERDDEGDDGEESLDEDVEEEEEETQQELPDTQSQQPQQETLETQPEAAAAALPENSQQQLPKRRKKDIPHYTEDVVHNVTLLEDMDLYTQQISMDLCQVTKVFDWRFCKRFAATDAYPASHKPIVASRDRSIMNIMNIPVTEDGPLCTVHKSVLTLEVQQLVSDPPNPARQAAAAATASSQTQTCWATSRCKLRVFLYNNHAETLRDILAGFDPKTQLCLLRFNNVPSRCIFPLANQHWYDQQEISDHCLCIGGPTILKMDFGNGRQRFDFDPPSLQLRVAIADKDTGSVVQEWSIQRNDYTRKHHIQIVQHDDTELLDRYHEWRDVWGLPDLHPKPPQEAENDKASTDFPLADDETENIQPAMANKEKEQEVPQRGDDPARRPLQQQAEQQQQQQQSSDQQQQTERQNQQENNSATRPAQEPPAGLPHAKRAKSSTKYVKMSELWKTYESHKTIQSRDGDFHGAVAAHRNNAKHQQCSVNLYAVVLEFSHPYQTSRGDWMVQLRLVDESISPEDHDEDVDVSEEWSSYPLLIFERDLKKLPRFRAAGDVVRLHRVELQEWQSDLQLAGRRKTSYTVYYGHPSTATSLDEGALSSPKNYSMAPEDKERFFNLWKWAQSRLIHHPTIKVSKMKTLAQVLQESDRGGESLPDEKDPEGDYTVMVTALIPVPPLQRSGITPFGFLRVWDGTGVSHSDRMPIGPPSQGEDPPSEAIVKISKIKELRDGRPQLQAPERLCGRVVNVMVWERSHWDFLNDLVGIIGRFIRLRNVHERFIDELGLRCLLVQRKTWLTPLPGDTFEVMDLLSNHSKRVARGEPFNPKSGVLPLHPERAATVTYPVAPAQTMAVAARPPRNPILSLAQYLHSPNVVFVGRVRVTKIGDSEFNSQADMSKLCRGARGFQFSLTLREIESDQRAAEVDVLVNNVVGENFFGMPAAQVCGAQSEVAFEALTTHIQQRTCFQVEIRRVSPQRTGQNIDFFVLRSIAPG